MQVRPRCTSDSQTREAHVLAARAFRGSCERSQRSAHLHGMVIWAAGAGASVVVTTAEGACATVVLVTETGAVDVVLPHAATETAKAAMTTSRANRSIGALDRAVL